MKQITIAVLILLTMTGNAFANDLITGKHRSALASVPNAATISWKFLSQNNIKLETACMALAIYHEARGEDLEGQLAVALVIRNRKRANAYPDTVCGVVYQGAHRQNRCQFSFACDEISDQPAANKAWERSLELARFVVRQYAFKGSRMHEFHAFGETTASMQHVTHYHADYVQPFWAAKLTKTVQVGRHIFYVSDRVLKKGWNGDA